MAGHRLLLYCSALLAIFSFALGAERRIEDAASAFQVYRIWDDYSMNVTGLPPESSETFKTVAMVRCMLPLGIECCHGGSCRHRDICSEALLSAGVLYCPPRSLRLPAWPDTKHARQR